MAYIEVVIKIPEEVYNIIKESREPMILAERLIKKGIPLPQGHGRLIDAEVYYNDMKKHYFDNTTVMRCMEIGLDCAPTIIEADRAERSGDINEI